MGSLLDKLDRLRDKWRGTQYPDGNVVPLSTTEVLDALLSVGSPPAPYRVHKAITSESIDLIAEWSLQYSSFGERVSQRIKIQMRLHPALHEVWAVQENWSITKGQLTRSWSHGRGSGFYVEWTYERGPDGRRRKVKTLDTRDMRNTLRKVVVSSGWTWRALGTM
ncbi:MULTISPECIES: hypothetical protein [Streptomyces]|uniref:Uncharacterized protein n=1 Tax=Streptomyces luteosporeus TaxID=173856 RepID=A0ABN3TPQ3_9ACTN